LQEFIGEVQLVLASVMSARGSFLRLPVTNTMKPAYARGHITVRGEEVKNCNAKLTIQLAAEKLDNKVCGAGARKGAAPLFRLCACVCVLVCTCV
jgi:hypothetical protein